METKDLEKILTKQREEYQRYLGIALEEQDSRIKLLAESLSSTRDYLSGMIETNREMIAKNAENMQIIKSDIQFIKQGLRNKVDRDEFEALEKRVMLLEKRTA